MKVLDFGLAKAVVSEPDPVVSTNSPTFTSPAHVTQAGMLLGTAPYMAPEQVRGKPADRRADIWSFGCVLYEMLAGHPPFRGQSLADTLGAIVRDEPRWEALPAATASPIRRLLMRCLTKDPMRRLRDIGEARIALDEQQTGAGGASSIAFIPSLPTRSRALWPLAITAAVLAIALAAVVLRLWRTGDAPRAPIVRFDVQPPAKAVLKLDLRPAVALSPDGSNLVFAAVSDGTARLYVRARDSVDARALPGSEGGESPAFSPDGRWIAFFADGKIKKVALDGPPLTLANVADVRGIAWQDDHTLIFPSGPADALVAMSADGGETRPVSKLAANERTHRWPEVLPGGKAVIFIVGSPASPDNYDDATIEAVILATGERTGRVARRRIRAVCAERASDPVTRSALYAVPFNPETLVARGNPTQVVQGVERDATTGAAHFACAADGTLAVVPGGGQSGIFRLVWVDRQGGTQPIALEPGFRHEAPDFARRNPDRHT